MIGLLATFALSAHLALLSLISFGGVPSVLGDIHNFVVTTHGWLSDREFAEYFGLVQAIPGPNMILMMGFIGWKVGGLGGAVASAVAIFAPSCAFTCGAYRLWDRFRLSPWQTMVRSGLVPLTIGLVVAGGSVMARAADHDWRTALVTLAALVLMLATRISPLWLLAAGGLAGALGFA
ncbi:MAG: chromate transporter [Stellaceae bacterium]